MSAYGTTLPFADAGVTAAIGVWTWFEDRDGQTGSDLDNARFPFMIQRRLSILSDYLIFNCVLRCSSHKKEHGSYEDWIT